jgi:hypothetical protein
MEREAQSRWTEVWVLRGGAYSRPRRRRWAVISPLVLVGEALLQEV